MIPDAMLPPVLAAHAAATLFMTGLIWFVQIVHYPLFARVGAGAFARYAREHQARTTLVVAPVMLIELATGAVLLIARPGGMTVAGAALLCVVWASTFAMQVPLHARLANHAPDNGPDSRLVRQLVRTNWIRTLAWSARGGLALLLVIRHQPA